MADNYLERKMEAYQARKAGGKATKRTGVAKTRRVFVTGGAAGIGRAIVKAFRSAGHRVAFCDVDETAGRELALHTGTDFFPLDVTDVAALEQCVQHLFEQWGDLDMVINNVGVGDFRPLTEMTVEAFDRVQAINVRPVFVTARLLALHRQQQTDPNPFGRIVNLCSTRYLMSEPGTEAYAASKGAIYSLTHALALSIAPLHVTVNCISPGWIETGDYAQLTTADHAQHPSGRVGRPEDIARMCLFLCQEENDFINGENITIDGGMTKKMIYV